MFLFLLILKIMKRWKEVKSRSKLIYIDRNINKLTRERKMSNLYIHIINANIHTVFKFLYYFIKLMKTMIIYYIDLLLLSKYFINFYLKMNTA